jgi:multiple sugar transport system permease protein
VPFEIEEAAAVDGARSFTILMRIIIPITVPGIVATSVLAFVLTWGDLLMALIITNQETATAPIAVLSFIRGSVGIEWGPLTAAVTIIMFPVIIFGLVFHRYLVAGMSGGAVK